MSVYIDELQKPLPEMKSKGKKWNYPAFCHLTADTLEELHKFAFDLGLKKDWFQDAPGNPHYKIVDNKRRVALGMGAIQKSQNSISTKAGINAI